MAAPVDPPGMNARSTRTVRGRLIALALLLSSKCIAGCAHPRPETIVARPTLTAVAVPDAECVRWLSARRGWGGASLGAATVAAGTGGLSAAFGQDDGVRLAFGIAGLLAGAFAAVAASVSGGYATDFGRYCAEGGNTAP